MTPRTRKSDNLAGFPERLDYLVGKESMSAFDVRCGFTSGYTYTLVTKGKKPSIDKVNSIILATKCNGHWLITGDGEPYGDEKSPPAIAEGLDNRQLSTSQVEVVELVLACQNDLSSVVLDCLRSPLFARKVAESVRRLRPTLQTISEAAKEIRGS